MLGIGRDHRQPQLAAGPRSLLLATASRRQLPLAAASCRRPQLATASRSPLAAAGRRLPPATSLRHRLPLSARHPQSTLCIKGLMLLVFWGLLKSSCYCVYYFSNI